jgi:hypothetical protein
MLVPVTRPSFDTRTLVRPNPVGLALPTPATPEDAPTRLALKTVGRETGW